MIYKQIFYVHDVNDVYLCSPLFVPTFVTLGRGFGFFLEFPGGFVTWIVPYLFPTLLPTWFCYINCSQICSWQPVCYINCSQICSWQPVCYMNCSQICSRQPGLLHELFPNFTPWTEIETTARNNLCPLKETQTLMIQWYSQLHGFFLWSVMVWFWNSWRSVMVWFLQREIEYQQHPSTLGSGYAISAYVGGP